MHKKKIRLSFSLYPSHNPTNTFTSLVRHQLPEKEGFDKKRYGFEFIDIPNSVFEKIKSFVETADKMIK